MSKQVRFRRGTTAQHATFTGIAGEVTVDTDKKTVVVHNGTTAGGIPMARADRPRGFTRQEIFTAGGTPYSIVGKTDLKRIRVTCYGGGGGGGGNSGGGGGGVSQTVLLVTDITNSTAITIGAGGTANNVGGTTSFGTFISATGGGGGSGATGGSGGTGAGAGGTGTPVFTLGGQGAGNTHASNQPFGSSTYTASRATGGNPGGGVSGSAGNGIRGGGGGAGASGAPGCIIIEEIYGFV